LTKEADGLVYINYHFEALDEDRELAFLAAAQMLESRTCIRFRPSAELPRLVVTSADPNACSCGVGYPGRQGQVVLNLGWCGSSAFRGNILHELGHAIGMTHTQQRPDAIHWVSAPEGRVGAHLLMHWENIPDWMRSEFAMDDRSYIGSAHAGYAPYDYESIMHYERGNPPRFDTLDPAYNAIVGQRDHLSEGDVQQIADLYQCGDGSAAQANLNGSPENER
jgi:hypothetical protein